MLKEKKAVFPEVQKLTIRYIFHAIFSSPVTDSQVDLIQDLFIKASPTSDYVTGALNPIGALVCCCQGSRNKAITEVKEIILQSPVPHLILGVLEAVSADLCVGHLETIQKRSQRPAKLTVLERPNNHFVVGDLCRSLCRAPGDDPKTKSASSKTHCTRATKQPLRCRRSVS
jgi:hypothetical protein